MIRVNYMEDIIKELSEKYDINEKDCEKNVKYIINRLLDIMEEPDTIQVSLGDLGYAYVSLPLIDNARGFNHEKSEDRGKKYNRLSEWIKERKQTFNLRRRYYSIPRIYRKYFKKGMTMEQLQNFQNEYKGEK